jgi:putative endonuclease
MYYVYVLRGPKSFYTGSTNDLKRRMHEHDKGRSFATKSGGPWKLIYYEACVAEKDARLREKYLKSSWGKRYIRSRTKYGT